MTTRGAAIAFYGALSIGPLLWIAISVASAIFGAQAVQGSVIAEISSIVGARTAGIIQNMLANSSSNADVASLVGLIILIFGATNVFVGVSGAFNAIWPETDDRPGWWRLVKDRGYAFLFLLISGGVLILFVALSAFVTSFGGELQHQFSLPAWLLIFAEIGFSFCATYFLFVCLYRYLPGRKLSWKNAAVGAVITSLLFVLGEYVLSIVFADGLLTTSAGTAGAMVVLLTWISYSVQIFLLGAEITSVYEDDKALI